MQDIVDELKEWVLKGEEIALATVISTWGSSPRPVGAKMGVNAKGGIVGSVSAGCVEGAVIEVCQEILHNGGTRLLHYGVSDDTAFDVGLMCGGNIEIYVRKLNNEIFSHWQRKIEEDKPCAVVTFLGGKEEFAGREGIFSEDGNYLAGDLPIHLVSQAKDFALEGIKKAKPVRFEAVELENADIFVDVTMPRPQLMIIGGVHISIPLVAMAKLMGYYTVVIDPRKAFCNEERFPHADKLVPKFAKQAFEAVPITTSSAVAVLTHDPKIDDEALICALNSPAFYIGGLGSKRTQALRRERLMKAGFTEDQLERIKGPIGLDILARTPEEIALSIMAEIVLVRNQQ